MAKRTALFHLAPEVQVLMEELIPSRHQHLANAKIMCVFQTDKPLKKFGKNLKVAAAIQVIIGERVDAVMVVDESRWDLLDPRRKEANVDALLCGMTYENDVLQVIQPDIVTHRKHLLAYGAITDELEFGLMDIKFTLPASEAK
jgi:hypothetical protein